MTGKVDAIAAAAPFAGAFAFAILLATSLLFALMLASANWAGAAAILGGVAGIALMLSGPRALLAFWLVGSPTFFVFFNNYLHTIPVLTMERVLFATLVLLVIVRTVWRKLPATRMDVAEKWMLAFLVVGLALLVPVSMRKPASEFLSRDAALYVQAYMMPIGAYMLARRLEWSEREVAQLGVALLIAGVVLSASAMLQVFAGVTALVPKYMAVIHSEDRAIGVFNNATEFGMVMNALLLLGLLFFVRARDGLLRATLLVYVAATFAAVILSTTRATWVGLIVSLLVVFMIDKRSRPSLGWLAASASAVAIAALPLLLESGSLARRVGDVEPILNRIAGAATALNIVAHNPLFGVGFERGAFGENMPEYLTGFGGVAGNWAKALGVPHDEHLNVAVLTGLSGFVPYVAMYVALFALLRSTRRDSRPDSLARDLAIYSTAMLASYVTNGLFVDFGSNIYIGILMFAAIALARCLSSHIAGGDAPRRTA